MSSWRSSSSSAFATVLRPALMPVLMPVLIVALALVLTLIPTAVGSLPLAAQSLSDAELELRRDRVLADPDLQTELPGWEAAGSRAGSGRDGARRQGVREGRERDWRLPRLPGAALLGTVGEIFQWALLAVGAVALVLLLVWLVLQLAISSRVPETSDKASDDEVAEGSSDRTSGRGSLADGDLDGLLRAGDYGAAAHLLLLRAVRLLARSGGRRIPVGHTSREVLASADLGPAAREAFDELVSAVERWLFGGRRLEREDFERCREAFRRLQTGLDTGAAEGAP